MHELSFSVRISAALSTHDLNCIRWKILHRHGDLLAPHAFVDIACAFAVWPAKHGAKEIARSPHLHNTVAVVQLAQLAFEHEDIDVHGTIFGSLQHQAAHVCAHLRVPAEPVRVLIQTDPSYQPAPQSCWVDLFGQIAGNRQSDNLLSHSSNAQSLQRESR